MKEHVEGFEPVMNQLVLPHGRQTIELKRVESVEERCDGHRYLVLEV